jgi:broad specificity phosphatase PhoE
VTIWLVRHGQSTLNAHGIRYRREDVPLTTLGIEQAAAVKIQGSPTVVTSSLLRAYGTACVIASRLGLAAPEVADELTERDWWQTCEEAAEIAGKYLDTLSGDVIAVTHAGVIKGLLGLEETPPNGSVHEWRP